MQGCETWVRTPGSIVTDSFLTPKSLVSLYFIYIALRKRCGVGRVKGSNTLPTSTDAVNTCGFAALPDEIYLEIVSHIPSVAIPISIYLEASYSDIRRSRRETIRSLSQTSRSIRRFFWRYLWQHIEVREGVKIVNNDGTLRDTRTLNAYYKKNAKELLRQLKIVTVRNLQLAQYVK